MWNRYKEWSIRQAKSAQCSPAAVLLGVGMVLVVVGYIYRKVVLETLEIAGLVLVSVLFVWMASLVARGLWAVHKRHAQAHVNMAGTSPDATAPIPARQFDSPTLKEMASISEDAMKLTDPNLGLRMDGDTLEIVSLKGKAKQV